MEAQIYNLADYKTNLKIIKDEKVKVFAEQTGLKPVTNAYDFTCILKETLSEEDFLDFWDAVFNEDAYKEADEDIKDFVDAYYELRS